MMYIYIYIYIYTRYWDAHEMLPTAADERLIIFQYLFVIKQQVPAMENNG